MRSAIQTGRRLDDQKMEGCLGEATDRRELDDSYPETIWRPHRGGNGVGSMR